ncbi:hypothetical protein [Halobacillus salinus]|uniref:Sporulation protein n=1 Tax=Halobacillus salinus TaxID=192814 RepID=A0A4Z0GY27_9BACI|nr:hypothetical protein [Halobacillus salinus]TGB01606.1 hypothetical protein E4663_15735 [Halobacillus salinus]
MSKTLLVIGAIMFLSACGLQTEHYQGQTSRDDVENMGMNDDATQQTQNPRVVNEPGTTWGLKQDRELMKQAVDQIPGVKVKRLIMEASQVWVTVDVDGAEDLSEEELKDWKTEVKQAIYRAVPRYNTHVKIN